MSCSQGLKFPIYRPIYRRYIGYRALSKRFLIQKIVCRKNREKSENVGDISAKYRILTEISIEISTLGRHARVGNFLVFSGRYITDMSAIFSIYRRYISQAACVAQICCVENPTVQIYPPFQTASLTDLMARF